MEEEILEQKRINPLLDNLRIPGETFRLPSCGLLYTNGELAPSVQNGEIHIHPMTAMDELIIRSPDKLFSGDAVRQVIKHCVPEVLKPDELFAKDVDFILVCLRKVSYSNEMTITWTHDCDDAKEHEYKVDVNHFIQQSKSIDPTTMSEKFTVTMPNGQAVTLRPPIFRDVVEMYQANTNDEDMDFNELKSQVISSFLNTIHSVDSVTDKELIKEWIEELPVSWIYTINDAITDNSDWGPTFDTEIKCADCGEKVTINTPLNPIAFFTLS